MIGIFLAEATNSLGVDRADRFVLLAVPRSSAFVWLLCDFARATQSD